MVQQPPGQPPGGAQPPPQPPPPPPGQPPQAPSGPPRAQFDTSNLPIPDIVVSGGALLALIFSFIAWYKVDFGYGFGSVTGRGWIQNLVLVVYLLLLLFAGFFTVNAMGNFVDLDLPLGPIYLIWAIVGSVLTLAGIVIRPGGGWDVVGMNWPVWIIMLLLSIIPIVGGAMKVQQS